MMQDVHVELKPRLPWKNKHSTRRGSFSPTKWNSYIISFWGIARRLNFMCQSCGTLCSILIGGASRKKSREIGVKFKEGTSKALH
jgi:hypothetical protein